MLEMAMCNVQSAITPNVDKPELRFMCSALCLIVLYICVKFLENITNGIRVSERTPVHGRNGYFQYLVQLYMVEMTVQCSKGNNSKSRQSELRFMYSAFCLIMLYICVKFHEYITNGIRVMEWTRVHGFVCVEVLRPSQPIGVMSSAVSLPNHTFTGQA